MMDVPAPADSDPRRSQAAGDGLWPGRPPVKSHDGSEDRLMEGGGVVKPMQMFTSDDSELLPEYQTSRSGAVAPSDKSLHRVSALAEAGKKNRLASSQTDLRQAADRRE